MSDTGSLAGLTIAVVGGGIFLLINLLITVAVISGSCYIALLIHDHHLKKTCEKNGYTKSVV